MLPLSTTTDSTETQATVAAWADETFGDVANLSRVIVRAAEEAVEALRDLTIDDNHAGAPLELADTIIVLFRAAERMNFDLLAEARLAMPDEAEVYPNTYLAATAAQYLLEAVRILSNPDHVPLRTLSAAQEIVTAVGYVLKIAEFMDADIQALINAKMAINRRRQWRHDGSGHGYHVRQEATQEAA